MNHVNHVVIVRKPCMFHEQCTSFVNRVVLFLFLDLQNIHHPLSIVSQFIYISTIIPVINLIIVLE